MSGPAWFVDPRPQRHTIYYPGYKEARVAKMAAGATAEELDAFDLAHSFEVELRGLTAGDKAVLDELKFTQESGAVYTYGQNQLTMLEMAITSWSLDAPINKETIARLQPEVAGAILEAIPDGRLVAPVLEAEMRPAEAALPPVTPAERTGPAPQGEEREAPTPEP